MSNEDQTIQWSRVVRVLYRARWHALAFFAIFLCAYAFAAWSGLEYSARAVIRTPELTLAEFKRFSESAGDPIVIADVARRRFAGDERMATIAVEMAKDANFAERFVPIYTISRADLRETTVAAPTTGQQIVGVQTTVESRVQAVARAMSILLAEAFADGALKSALVEYVASQRGLLQTNADRLEAKEAADRALLQRVEARITDLQRLRATYPDAKSDQRQVVSIADGGAKYLSPVAQLVGAESEAIGIRDLIRETERKRRVLGWQKQYFAKVAELSMPSLSGASLLAKLESLAGPDDGAAPVQDDAVREARAVVIAELSAFRGRYVDGYTLLRVPPERLSRLGPSLWLHAVGGIIASLVLALIVTLALRWRQLAA